MPNLTEKQLGELEADAARYQYLKERSHNRHVYDIGLNVWEIDALYSDESTLDEAIDNAFDEEPTDDQQDAES